MTIHNIKQWLLPFLCGLWLPFTAPAQDISSLSPSLLPYGANVKGLYQIEADDAGGLYLKEQANGTITTAVPDTEDPGSYFWLVENVYTETFQLYSARQQGKLLEIDAAGTAQWTADTDVEASQLLFRMYPEGPQRTAADEGVVAIGYITTKALTANYGNADCQCNMLTANTNARFKIHDSGINGENYRPVAFEKADDTNINGSVTTDTQNNVTRISQTLTGFGLPQNFVSSNFFVKGFGEDDFEITIAPGTEGYIGFLDYTQHHFTKEVYRAARPKIGLKIANDAISLVYLSGAQPLPYNPDPLGREVATGFVTGTPVTLGFKGQDTLAVSQSGITHVLERTVPAELFMNQSVTQNARMLVQLTQGEVELSYTTKNYLINSEDDFGVDDGSNFVSTHAFFPYNEGNTLINTFDWQQTQWPVRYVGNGGTVEDLVFSPFYANSTEFSGISARFDPAGNYTGGEDFATTEGWELIKADLGYHANGTARNQAPAHPYIIFYDKVAGTLRVFVYTNNEGEANQLTVSLSAMGGLPTNQQGYVPKLWGSLQQFSAMDQVQNSAYSKALPFYSASARDWYFADFIMEYDPCIAFFESTLKLQVYKTTQGDLTMVGRLEGGSLPAGTPEYNNWKNQRENFLLGVMDNNFGGLQNTLGDITFNQYDNFDLLQFKDTIGGLLVGKKIEDWEKEKARIEWQATKDGGIATIAEGSFKIAEGAAKIVEGASGFHPAGSAVASGAKIAGGIATMGVGASKIASGEAKLRLAGAKKLHYDNIKDKVKRSDQNIKLSVPPPRPHAVFGELALKGTLTIETTLIPEAFIATPGGLGSEAAPEWYVNGSRGSAPLYNKPVGNFNLLKQPQFGVGIVQSTNAGYKAYLKIKEKPYFAHNNTVLGKINDVLTISIHVQTLDNSGKVIRSSTGENGYTTLFGTPENNALPGEMDISELIDWEQIDLNITELTDPSAQDIENQLSNWVQVSYEVWSLTLTSLKSRDLSRVFANGDQYYNGQSIFAFDTIDTFSTNELDQVAKTLAAGAYVGPDPYDFSDDPGFGDTYNLYHTAYDEAGDKFYTVMNNYCTALETAQHPGAKNMGSIPDVKGEETAEEEVAGSEALTVAQPGLTVYPNPVKHQLHFRLVSQETGQAGITLYDLLGRALISTTDRLDGSSTLQGLVNISSLPAGIYILEIKLPGGNSLTKKIVKQ